jgi:carbon-monoxide dehydrogenase small subunit
MLISAQSLLNETLQPTDEEIREALSANICRCTGYVQIIEAVKLAAKNLHEAETAKVSTTEASNV